MISQRPAGLPTSRVRVAPLGGSTPRENGPANAAVPVATGQPITAGALMVTFSQLLSGVCAFLTRLFAQIKSSLQAPATPGAPVAAPTAAIPPAPPVSPSPAPTTSVPTTPVATTPPSQTTPPAAGPQGVPGNWQLAFDDEFNAPENWGKVWSQMRANHWKMNNVTTDTQNVSVSNGVANLTLANSSSGAYMSTLPTDGGGGFQMGYGYAEARIKLPVVNGQIVGWPAWWICGEQWPAQGEADIFEGLGGTATSNYHSNAGANNSGAIAGNWSGWHTFGIDREPGVNRIYWDGKLVRTYATDDNGAPEGLILNFGSGGGPQVDGATMQVDYVRVWQRQGQ